MNISTKYNQCGYNQQQYEMGGTCDKHGGNTRNTHGNSVVKLAGKRKHGRPRQ